MRYQLTILLCLALSPATFTKKSRIYGGEDASILDYPYSAALATIRNEYFFCGGTIITSWHVLTAAHCIVRYEFFQFKVYAGSTSLDITAESGYRVRRMLIHPNFTGQRDYEGVYLHDIAVLTLQQCIRFNRFRNKIDLPTSNYVPNRIGTLAGWGKTDFDLEYFSYILQRTTMKIFSLSRCNRILPFFLQDQQICAFNRNGVGACFGDSGSPLTVNGVLVGITSFIRPCATGMPDIFTNVYSYLSFITNELSNIDSLFCI